MITQLTLPSSVLEIHKAWGNGNISTHSYTYLATLKGKNNDTRSVNSLFVVDINKNIDDINKFLKDYNHIIKHIDLQITRKKHMCLFIYKRKRLGRTDKWHKKEIKSFHFGYPSLGYST